MFTPGVMAPEGAADEALWFVFRGETLLLVAEGEAARMPCAADLPEGTPSAADAHFLGSLGARNCFAARWDEEAPAPEGMEWVPLRGVFGRAGETFFALAGRASQILHWDSTHRFCGRCGTETRREAGERARTCPSCGLASYPRLSPAVMVLIRRGRELLLARSPRFPEGMFSALAGFVEPGETLEETIAREVREEVGLGVANLRYFGSQSWPFPHSLMIAFLADYADGEITPQPEEIEAADWFTVDSLPRLPHPVSIARRLIEDAVAAILRGE